MHKLGEMLFWVCTGIMLADTPAGPSSASKIFEKQWDEHKAKWQP